MKRSSLFRGRGRSKERSDLDRDYWTTAFPGLVAIYDIATSLGGRQTRGHAKSSSRIRKKKEESESGLFTD